MDYVWGFDSRMFRSGDMRPVWFDSPFEVGAQRSKVHC